MDHEIEGGEEMAELTPQQESEMEKVKKEGREATLKRLKEAAGSDEEAQKQGYEDKEDAAKALEEFESRS
jgi:hypothetical protein